jgi:glycerol dehydrogenase
MSEPKPYFPQAVFGGDPSKPGGPQSALTRVLLAPQRYVQGQGVLDAIGIYLSIIPSRRPVVLISDGGNKRFGGQLQESITQAGLPFLQMIFGGECCLNEIQRLAGLIREQAGDVDALVTVGGGKCLDTGKAVAYRLGVPVVSCPTIASTDAPCSAVSVIYTDDGVQVGPEFYPSNPTLVVVDTRIIIDAPLRQLVSGMGDALATYYEARTCFENPAARSMVGARPTIAALAIGRLCAETVLEKGLEAVAAVLAHRINEAFEQVVEANTLLSGMGFESGGLATTHAVAAGLTVIPDLHKNYFHGELVGIGILSHLLLEGRTAEAEKVGTFLAKIGLPVHAGQLGLDLEKDADDLMAVMENAVGSHLTDSEPVEVTPAKLVSVFAQAHQLGLRLSNEFGEEAYQRLHAEH